MVHTIQLYCPLDILEIRNIEEKFNMDIKFIDGTLDRRFRAVKTSITKRYFDWGIYLVVDIIKLLGYPDFSEIEYPIIEQYLNLYMNQIGLQFKDLTLLRIDYRLDVCIPDKSERDLLFKLYEKTIEMYRFKVKNISYDTTIYYNCKSTGMIIYGKSEERRDKEAVVMDFEEDVIRFEYRVLNKHLNNNKHKNNIKKELRNYFTKEQYLKYMEKNFEAILYKGDHYKIFKIDTILKKNTQLNEKSKIIIRQFLFDVSNYGITAVKNMKNKEDKLIYSKYQFNTIIKSLQDINVNPILIPRDWGCPSIIKNPFSSNIVKQFKSNN
ncbi:hypothetical protein [Clostridium sp.]